MALSILLWAGNAASADLPLLKAIEEAYAAHEAGPTIESYKQLRAVYARLESQPNRRGIVGQMLERDGEALSAMQTLLNHCTRGGNTDLPSCSVDSLAEVELLIQGIIENSAVVTLTLPGSQHLSVDDTRNVWPAVHNEYGPFYAESVTLRVRAGDHKFVIHDVNGSECRWEAHLSGGDSATHTCAPALKARTEKRSGLSELLLAEPPPHVEDSSRNTWVAPSLLTLGGTALGASLAAYVQSRRVGKEAERDYASRCLIDSPRPSCFMEDSSPLFGQAGDWKTASAVSATIGGAALAAGAVLYFWPSDEDKDVTAWVSPTGVGVSAAF